MVRAGMTVRDATREWVKGFDAIQQGMIERLIRMEPDQWYEITKPAKYDRVYVVNSPPDCSDYGEIVAYDSEDGQYDVLLDSGETISATEEELEVEREGFLPMWGTMWSFGENIDDYWLEELNGLQLMSDCGFRIYESAEFGYFFGIDGAGYDFYEQHWIPLYNARGLHWHDTDE